MCTDTRFQNGHSCVADAVHVLLSPNVIVRAEASVSLNSNHTVPLCQCRYLPMSVPSPSQKFSFVQPVMSFAVIVWTYHNGEFLSEMSWDHRAENDPAAVTPDCDH